MCYLLSLFFAVFFLFCFFVLNMLMNWYLNTVCIFEIYIFGSRNRVCLRTCVRACVRACVCVCVYLVSVEITHRSRGLDVQRPYVYSTTLVQWSLFIQSSIQSLSLRTKHSVCQSVSLLATKGKEAACDCVRDLWDGKTDAFKNSWCANPTNYTVWFRSMGPWACWCDLESPHLCF